MVREGDSERVEVSLVDPGGLPLASSFFAGCRVGLAKARGLGGRGGDSLVSQLALATLNTSPLFVTQVPRENLPCHLSPSKPAFAAGSDDRGPPTFITKVGLIEFHRVRRVHPLVKPEPFAPLADLTALVELRRHGGREEAGGDRYHTGGDDGRGAP